MKPAVMVGAPAICGKWGWTTIINTKGGEFQVYCNAKPDHEGGCSYTNAEGRTYALGNKQGVSDAR